MDESPDPHGRADAAPQAPLQQLHGALAAAAGRTGPGGQAPGLPGAHDAILDALLACAAALDAQALRLDDRPGAATIFACVAEGQTRLAECPGHLLRALQDELLQRCAIERGAVRQPLADRDLPWPKDRAGRAGAWHIRLSVCPLADRRMTPRPGAHAVARLALRLALRRHTAAVPALETLGFEASDVQALRRRLRQPQGLIVLIGPRTAGLSTSAYAMLDTLEDSSAGARSVQTLEPRALRPTPHWTQCAPALAGAGPGVDPAGLLALAPDVLLLDLAGTALAPEAFLRQALLAVADGVLVLLTVRGARAHHVFGMLRRLGVAPQDLAPHLALVLAQRLVRRLCPHCAQADDSTELRHALASAANSWLREGAAPGARAAAGGCARCHGRGYAGCALLYELLDVDDGVRAMVEDGVVGLELEQRMLTDGRSLWDHGLRLLARGATSLAALRAALCEPG